MYTLILTKTHHENYESKTLGNVKVRNITIPGWRAWIGKCKEERPSIVLIDIDIDLYEDTTWNSIKCILSDIACRGDNYTTMYAKLGRKYETRS